MNPNDFSLQALPGLVLVYSPSRAIIKACSHSMEEKLASQAETSTMTNHDESAIRHFDRLDEITASYEQDDLFDNPLGLSATGDSQSLQVFLVNDTESSFSRSSLRESHEVDSFHRFMNAYESAISKTMTKIIVFTVAYDLDRTVEDFIKSMSGDITFLSDPSYSISYYDTDESISHKEKTFQNHILHYAESSGVEIKSYSIGKIQEASFNRKSKQYSFDDAANIIDCLGMYLNDMDSADIANYIRQGRSIVTSEDVIGDISHHRMATLDKLISRYDRSIDSRSSNEKIQTNPSRLVSYSLKDVLFVTSRDADSDPVSSRDEMMKIIHSNKNNILSLEQKEGHSIFDKTSVPALMRAYFYSLNHDITNSKPSRLKELALLSLIKTTR